MENGQMPRRNCRDSARLRVSSRPVSIGVDGSGIGDIGHVVIRDRRNFIRRWFGSDFKHLVTMKNKQLVSGSDIMSRGFIYMRESSDLIHLLQSSLKLAINRGLNENGTT